MQAKFCRRQALVHCPWLKSTRPIGKAPRPGSNVRRRCGLAVMPTCSMSARATMMSDPNTQPIGQSPGSATIIANIGIMIERPIKRPAMKLPACRNLANGFFTMRSSPDNHGLERRDVSVRQRTDGFRAEMTEGSASGCRADQAQRALPYRHRCIFPPCLPPVREHRSRQRTAKGNRNAGSHQNAGARGQVDRRNRHLSARGLGRRCDHRLDPAFLLRHAG